MIIYHLSNIIYHISFIKYHLSNIIYQISFIIYHISYIFCHISYFIFLISPSYIYIYFCIYHHHISSSHIIIIYHHHISSSYIIITYHHHISYHCHLPSQWKPITITVASNTGIFSQGSSVKNILECRTVFDRVRPGSVFDMAQRMFKSFSTHFVGAHRDFPFARFGVFFMQLSIDYLETVQDQAPCRLKFRKVWEALWISLNPLKRQISC